MKGIIASIALYLSVGWAAANIISDELQSSESDVLPFNNKRVDYKYASSDCNCPKNPQPADCEELLENGHNVSGMYVIKPRSHQSKCNTLEVYCDMETDGGGWTVIQRRGKFGNAVNYFAKNWQAYKNGFGNLQKEFWMGNDNIHALTTQGSYSVRFEMTRTNGEFKYALHDTFWIEDEQHNYRLHLQDYSGTAGDALTPHDMGLFYTKDRQNLPENRKDSDKQHVGGWWHNMWPSSNLNGLNKQGKDKEKIGNGVVWYGIGDGDLYMESLGATEIKVRKNSM